MEPSFWHARWRRGQIGFHNARPHPLLTRHFPALCGGPAQRVLAPLCGKSLDLLWLTEQGHDVVGIELSEIAARDYFAERGVTPEVDRQGAAVRFRHGAVRILAADIRDVQPQDVGPVDAVYDRAALVALPESMREVYVSHLRRLAGAVPQLLITVEYDASLRGGPPFSVLEDEVRRLYAPNRIECLSRIAAQLKDLPCREAAYCVTPEPAAPPRRSDPSP